MPNWALGPRPTRDRRRLPSQWAAQAQAELAWDILRGLSGALRKGLMRLNLVAGVAPRWNSTAARPSPNWAPRRNSGVVSTCESRPPRTSTSRRSTSCTHLDLVAPALHQLQRQWHRQPQLSRRDQAAQVPFHLGVGLVVAGEVAVDVPLIEGGCVGDRLARRGDQFVVVAATSNRADWACAGTVLSTRP